MIGHAKRMTQFDGNFIQASKTARSLSPGDEAKGHVRRASPAMRAPAFSPKVDVSCDVTKRPLGDGSVFCVGNGEHGKQRTGSNFDELSAFAPICSRGAFYRTMACS
jgi:hypothetical protein